MYRYICMHICVYVHMCADMCICMSIYMHVYICMRICMYRCMIMRKFMHICICMNTSIYMCILVYVSMCFMYSWSTLVMWLECRFLFGGLAADAALLLRILLQCAGDIEMKHGSVLTPTQTNCLRLEIRMEVASSRPDHLPTLSVAKTSKLSLLVKYHILALMRRANNNNCLRQV